MADVLRVGEQILGGGRIFDDSTGQQQPASYGFGVLPETTFSLETGTGSGQANKWYLARRTLAATTYDLLDLAGGLSDYKGNAITLTTLKRALVKVVSADGSKRLRVGPQNQANAAQLGWGGTGATVYADVYDVLDLRHPWAGWAVTAGTGDVFPVYNPTAGSIDYAVWLLGVG